MITCYDVADGILSEAGRKFAPGFAENAEKRKNVKVYCEVIDRLAAEFDGISFEVEVDPSALKIHMRLECVDLALESPNHELYDLAGCAESCIFSQSEEGNLLIDFVFPGIWDRV